MVGDETDLIHGRCKSSMKLATLDKGCCEVVMDELTK